MDYLYEKISYLKGMAEGLNIEEDSKEGKLLLHIVDVLDDFADALEDIYEEQNEIGEYLDFIDEDLTEVEEDIYGEYEVEDDENLE
ncbi:MAG: hypothetical protein FH751_08005 [Firmicutes bacterium]|nr:hypothetical protein [Bacillota bacterium]